jgi:hypothetical protein
VQALGFGAARLGQSVAGRTCRPATRAFHYPDPGLAIGGELTRRTYHGPIMLGKRRNITSRDGIGRYFMRCDLITGKGGGSAMIGMPEGVRKLLVAYDVEGYGGRGKRQEIATQRRDAGEGALVVHRSQLLTIAASLMPRRTVPVVCSIFPQSTMLCCLTSGCAERHRRTETPAVSHCASCPRAG